MASNNPFLQVIEDAPKKEEGSNPFLDTLGAKEKAREVQAAQDAEFDRQLLAPPTEGMSMGEKLGAGFISGLLNVGQGVGNMLGIVDDATITERKRLEAPLSDTTAGSVGQFGGELAALAPLGLVGKGAQGVNAAVQGTRGMLPTATRVLSSTGGAATAEGALGGAILSNPNERGEGAALGAGAGLLLNKAMGGMSRFWKDGLAKPSKSATELTNYVEKMTGKRPFIPLAQAVDQRSGPITAKAKSYADIASLLPSARAKFESQAKELTGDVYEANLRKAFSGFGKSQGDVGVKIFRETGDMQMALEAAKNAKRVPKFSTSQEVLDTASRKAPRGEYSPSHLRRAAEASEGDIAHAPFRREALLMEDVLPKDVGKSTVAAREGYRDLTDVVGFAADRLPWLGSVLSSRSLQNFLMGSTFWQRQLKKSLNTGSGKDVRATISRIRAAMSAQPAESDESNDMVSPQELVKDYASQASNALRGT